MLEKIVTSEPGIAFAGPSNKGISIYTAISLNNPEFEQHYLETLKELSEKEGLWKENKALSCSSCTQEIPSIACLRRLYGKNLHPQCFRRGYETHKGKVGLRDKKYLDRVAQLPDELKLA